MLSNERFSMFPSVSGFIISNSALVAALTFFTVLFQILFPLLVWTKMKPLMVLAGLSLHLGIGILMGMYMFSLTMIVADLSLLSDRTFDQVLAYWVRCSVRISSFIRLPL